MNAENILTCWKYINLLCESQKGNFRLKWNCTFVTLHIILIKLTVTLVLLVLGKLQIWKEQTLCFISPKTACYCQIISCCQLTIIRSNFLVSVFYWEGGGGEEHFIAVSCSWLVVEVFFISLGSSYHIICYHSRLFKAQCLKNNLHFLKESFGQISPKLNFLSNLLQSQGFLT